MRKFYLLFIFCIASAFTVVSAQSTPYLGVPNEVPGFILAVNFDEGGQDVAYWDAEENNPNPAIRPGEWIDCEPSVLGGADVGWTNAGEWINYTIKVDSTAEYAFAFHYASGTSAADTNLANIVFASGTVLNLHPDSTGGWQTWSTLYDTVSLTKGIDTMKIVMLTGGFNFHNFELTRINGDARVDSFIIGNDTLRYAWNLNYDLVVSEIPEISQVFLSDPMAKAEITKAATIPGSSTIKVTSVDGTVTNLYTVNFTAPSTDASLKFIKIGRDTLTSYSPDVFSYDVELEKGTTRVPTVVAKSTDTNAKVKITKAEELPGTTTIEVTAEDGITINTYSINFTVATGVGVNTIDANSITMYPNPGKYLVTINLGNITGSNKMLSVIDLSGKTIKKVNIGTLERYEMNVSDLENSVYLVRITTNQKVYTSRLVVNK